VVFGGSIPFHAPVPRAKTSVCKDRPLIKRSGIARIHRDSLGTHSVYKYATRQAPDVLVVAKAVEVIGMPVAAESLSWQGANAGETLEKAVEEPAIGVTLRRLLGESSELCP
jgi:hypothetical protein